MAWEWKRYVTGLDKEGRSCIVFDRASNTSDFGQFSSAELWATSEMPIDNTGSEDQALSQVVHEPPPGGTIFRAVLVNPDPEWGKIRQWMEKFHDRVGSRRVPTAEDYAKHPNMHKTNTITYVTMVLGEMWVVTETDEVLMRPGDSIVVRGHNHAWSNRSDKPCLFVAVLADAKPLP